MQERVQPEAAAAVAPALKGIKVLDLTQFEAGPSCADAVAWVGADVVKVEDPNRGEPGRWGSSDRADADSHYFIYYNLNKRSVTCNLKSEEGKALLRRMIAKADVVIENMAPGTFARLGFDYPRLSAIKPRLIFAQVKGFAPESPHANYLSFDMIAQAMGGSMGVNGRADDPPVRPGPPIGPTRAQNREFVDGSITEWTSKRTKQEVTQVIAGAGVPCGAVMTTLELMHDPDLHARGMMQEIDHPVRGKVIAAGWPLRMSDTKVALKSSPVLGGDCEAIYGEWLGCSPDEVRDMRQAKVI